MFFKKKKGMIDVGEMQKRGLVFPPKKDASMDKYKIGKGGFIELKGDGTTTITDTVSHSSPPTEKSGGGFGNFFGFMDSSSSSIPTSSPSSSESSQFSASSEGYDKREVDEKIEKLDNMIYKLEQRIEVLERKLNVNQSGW